MPRTKTKPPATIRRRDPLATCDQLSRDACDLAWEHMWRTPGDAQNWRVWIHPAIDIDTPHEVKVCKSSPGTDWRSLHGIRVGGHLDLNQMHNTVRFALREAPVYATTFVTYDKSDLPTFDLDSLPPKEPTLNQMLKAKGFTTAPTDGTHALGSKHVLRNGAVVFTGDAYEVMAWVKSQTVELPPILVSSGEMIHSPGVWGWFEHARHDATRDEKWCCDFVAAFTCNRATAAHFQAIMRGAYTATAQADGTLVLAFPV